MQIREDILNELISSRHKRSEKKEKILSLKEEILELRRRGLSLSQIVDYLKRAHKLKTTTTYLKKVIPELSSRVDYLANLLKNMNNEEIAEALSKLGNDRVRQIVETYKAKFVKPQ
jgi:DNA-binding transcriptional MerR regulator